MIFGEELAEKIILFDNVFVESEKHIKKILDKNIEWKKAKIYKDSESAQNNLNVRNTDIILLPSNKDFSIDTLSDLSKDFSNSIQPYLDHYIGKYNLSVKLYENPQLLRYGKGQKFDEHSDRTMFFPRNISLTYYINEDYEGGEIEFVNFNLKVKSKKNQLLIFPSTDLYKHKVHAVTGGLRYVIVQWIR
jgi:predicted 2-oxoglutarate/Fe(II)-dependent dioxygenase YbiX